MLQKWYKDADILFLRHFLNRVLTNGQYCKHAGLENGALNSNKTVLALKLPFSTMYLLPLKLHSQILHAL